MNWLATLCPCSHFKLSATEELCSFASKSAQFKLLSFTIIVSSVFLLSQLIFVFNTSCTQHSLRGTLSTSPCLPYWMIVNASLSWNVIFTVKGSSVFLSVITCSPIGQLSCFYM